jgi:hypothetical protein
MNRFRYSVVIALLVLPSLARAAEPKPYQPQGAPADPKVSVRWNKFHDYKEATEILQELAKTFPQHAKLVSLGPTYGKREMWLLTIGDVDGDADSKPAYWIDGGIHANEIQASEVVLYTAWYLCEMKGRSDFVDRLLKERTFYLVPMMSPDSRDAHFYEPNTTHSPRGGQRPVDDDRDGLVDEDKPDDLDGDGQITQMRVKDPNGRFKPHADFPQLMIRVKDGEKGEYRLLGSEGFDNDGDGDVNEDADGYYDPNRDWAWDWQPRYVQGGAHRYPFSVPENRLVADFIKTRPNIGGSQSFHNAGGMILRGPGEKGRDYDGADVGVYNVLGRQGEKLLPGYRYMHTGNDLYEVFGGEIDWWHESRGAFAFTNELFSAFNYFRSAEHGGFFGSEETQQLFNKYLLFEEGVVPWKEVDHPQYGKIEVGGATKNWIRQPPSFLLEEECHRNMAFSLYCADQLPLVKVQRIDVKDLGGDIREVTAVIENDRVCPTHSIADVKRKITPPDEVTITGDGVKVLLGLIADEPFFQQPREQKRTPGTLQLDRIPGRDVVYVRWLVEGKGKLEVSVKSVKGGSDKKGSE